jgi:RHS repeat-associated protein
MGNVTADGGNHISALTYDVSGNTTGDGTDTYTWNGDSQLTSGGGVNYTYDGDGNRVSKSNGELYWYDTNNEVLSQTDASGNTLDDYVFFGGKRIALLPNGGSPAFYAEDFLGSSRVMVEQGGTLCYDADFAPYGAERSNTNSCAQNYKFEGKERDVETQNDDFEARYYSWRFGRWLSSDWSGTPVPVPYANFTNPQTLNLYSMVQDDPETFADLDGHCGGGGSSTGDFLGCVSEAATAFQFGFVVGIEVSGSSTPAADNAPTPNQGQTEGKKDNFWQKLEKAANWVAGRGARTNAEIVEEERQWLTNTHVATVGADGKLAPIDWSKKSDAEVEASYKYMHDVSEAATIDHFLSIIGIAATVTFGHGARHLAGTGLNQADVEAAIQRDIRAGVRNATQPTSTFWGRVNVGGQTIEYRAYTLPNGTINVGTYYIP